MTSKLTCCTKEESLCLIANTHDLIRMQFLQHVLLFLLAVQVERLSNQSVW